MYTRLACSTCDVLQQQWRSASKEQGGSWALQGLVQPPLLLRVRQARVPEAMVVWDLLLEWVVVVVVWDLLLEWVVVVVVWDLLLDWVVVVEGLVQLLTALLLLHVDMRDQVPEVEVVMQFPPLEWREMVQLTAVPLLLQDLQDLQRVLKFVLKSVLKFVMEVLQHLHHLEQQRQQSRL